MFIFPVIATVIIYDEVLIDSVSPNALMLIIHDIHLDLNESNFQLNNFILLKIKNGLNRF